MKIRNGFVSNSSSSSFIIAFKECVPCSHCGRKDTDILKAIEENDHGMENNRIYAIGTNVLKAIGEHFYSVYSEERIAELKGLIEQYIKDGYTVADISISYHSDILNGLLENGFKSGNIQILEDVEGKFKK